MLDDVASTGMLAGTTEDAIEALGEEMLDPATIESGVDEGWGP